MNVSTAVHAETASTKLRKINSFCNSCQKEVVAESFFPRCDIFKCKSCQLVFYREFAIDTADLYTAKYFSDHEYQDYVGSKQTIQQNFSQRIDYLKTISHPGDHLLEIGSAYGFFLELASQHWNSRGIDICEDGVRYSQEKLRLKSTYGNFLEAPTEEHSQNLVCLWDTIEHLNDPFGFLSRSYRWLKPGGHIVMTTGEIGSFVAKLRGSRWRMIHPPSHLYYFSKQTLTRMLNKCGFKVADIRYVGYSRTYQSIIHNLLTIKQKDNETPEAYHTIYNLLTLKNRINFPIYMNFFDIMQVTAKKCE